MYYTSNTCDMCKIFTSVLWIIYLKPLTIESACSSNCQKYICKELKPVADTEYAGNKKIYNVSLFSNDPAAISFKRIMETISDWCVMNAPCKTLYLKLKDIHKLSHNTTLHWLTHNLNSYIHSTPCQTQLSIHFPFPICYMVIFWPTQNNPSWKISDPFQTLQQLRVISCLTLAHWALNIYTKWNKTYPPWWQMLAKVTSCLELCNYSERFFPLISHFQDTGGHCRIDARI